MTSPRGQVRTRSEHPPELAFRTPAVTTDILQRGRSRLGRPPTGRMVPFVPLRRGAREDQPLAGTEPVCRRHCGRRHPSRLRRERPSYPCAPGTIARAQCCLKQARASATSLILRPAISTSSRSRLSSAAVVVFRLSLMGHEAAHQALHLAVRPEAVLMDARQTEPRQEVSGRVRSSATATGVGRDNE